MASQPMRLFPLQVVLLPGEPLPLHIFEERYKLMIRECIEGDFPFGLVLADARGLRKVGCTAKIVQVIEKYPDGKMNILVQGERRFRILSTTEERSYPFGEVEFLEDAEGAPPAPDLIAELIELFAEKRKKILEIPDEIRDDPARLSFIVGAAIEMPLERKQAFLEITSPPERFRRLIGELKSLERRREEIARGQHKAERNGHP